MVFKTIVSREGQCTVSFCCQMLALATFPKPFHQSTKKFPLLGLNFWKVFQKVNVLKSPGVRCASRELFPKLFHQSTNKARQHFTSIFFVQKQTWNKRVWWKRHNSERKTYINTWHGYDQYIMNSTSGSMVYKVLVWNVCPWSFS